MKNTTSRPPVWFYILTIILLLWNAMGLFAFFDQVMISAARLEALPDNERNLYENTPVWAVIAFALAVFGGTLGCIGLLLRRSWARILFLISLVGIMVQMYYNVFIGKAMDVYGPGAVTMPVLVLLVAVFLIWFANYGIRRGWLG
ncbi:hypothetical protein KUV50_13910 [Membranicola marinus]|uniref:Sugar transporter n=1 Tax=Membranihabitans marinus TaxID=1227546 RepID=A0A953HQX4_9BACT|nr:hypothetical protein [Membranihabitans marinus]MBY5959243.1 hypothetical protein [Membranihabitans marinus]